MVETTIISSRGTKAEALRVARDMRAMSSAFCALGMGTRDSENLSFHLAEVRQELHEVGEVLKVVSKTGKCSQGDYEMLVNCLAVHWRYHMPKAWRILERDLSDAAQ